MTATPSTFPLSCQRPKPLAAPQKPAPKSTARECGMEGPWLSVCHHFQDHGASCCKCNQSSLGPLCAVIPTCANAATHTVAMGHMIRNTFATRRHPVQLGDKHTTLSAAAFNASIKGWVHDTANAPWNANCCTKPCRPGSHQAMTLPHVCCSTTMVIRRWTHCWLRSLQQLEHLTLQPSKMPLPAAYATHVTAYHSPATSPWPPLHPSPKHAGPYVKPSLSKN
jgi:hypothetical protein